MQYPVSFIKRIQTHKGESNPEHNYPHPAVCDVNVHQSRSIHWKIHPDPTDFRRYDEIELRVSGVAAILSYRSTDSQSFRHDRYYIISYGKGKNAGKQWRKYDKQFPQWYRDDTAL